ncbi:MAG TPA: NDP-sugar synthase [Candidatus Limnocylindria bacterium]|nr:NDP-sugar synthase [Candidatus Limnocylindria bacterium]
MTVRRAMVLAAGHGRRLAPLTDTLPKPLMPVGGRPLVAHVLAFLRAGGIEEVVINLHHLGARIEEAIGDGRAYGLTVRYSHEPEIRDTGGGIKQAERWLAGEPFVVANGDSLLDLALDDVLAFHRARGGIATMVVRPDPDAARYGLVELDADDRVRRISGLPAAVPQVALRPFMFPGLHVFEPRVFDWMDAGAAFSVTRVTYPRLLEAGEAVYGYVTDARWVTIDTPEALAAADAEVGRAPFRFATRRSAPGKR